MDLPTVMRENLMHQQCDSCKSLLNGCRSHFAAEGVLSGIHRLAKVLFTAAVSPSHEMYEAEVSFRPNKGRLPYKHHLAKAPE